MWEGRTNVLIPITTFGIEIREELSLGTDTN